MQKNIATPKMSLLNIKHLQMLRLRNYIFIALMLSALLIISQKNHLPFLSFFSRAERAHVDDFIDYSMIRSFGIYTLFGLKPVTEIDIGYSPEKENLKSKSPWGVATKTQWHAFKKEIEKLNLENYFFIECFDTSHNSVIFVHQPSLIEVLDHYHTQFEKGTGEKFNTLFKVNELKRGGSAFWDKIFKEKNHYLMGLVFGFGEENSRYFNEESNGNAKLHKKRVEHTSLMEMKKLLKDEISVEDLTLPYFISYQENDKILDNYRISRRKIMKLLTGKNLTKEVFSILSSPDNKYVSERL